MDAFSLNSEHKMKTYYNLNRLPVFQTGASDLVQKKARMLRNSDQRGWEIVIKLLSMVMLN